MAEYCRECYKDMNPRYARKKLIMSKDRDICDVCGKDKKVVITFDNNGFVEWLLNIIKKVGI